MEFHEKLQELRRQRGLTQEELAGALYVSRTAVSKWESGRGYPNLDSLRAIAKFYGVTVDELLSSTEVLEIAEESEKQSFCFSAGLRAKGLPLSPGERLWCSLRAAVLAAEIRSLPCQRQKPSPALKRRP